jgi:hypothetical protein
MPGNTGAVACTAESEWVLMGGDCCHHGSLLRGERPMSVTLGPNSTPSFHRDPEAATDTIDKVRLLSKGSDVFVVLAHDASLEGKMPEYPKSLNGWKNNSWWREWETSAGDWLKQGGRNGV